MTPIHYSRQQVLENATLTKDDLIEVARCRRKHNRLGFAYQIGFVRLANRFPAQQPFELIDELLTFISVQLDISPNEIHHYASRQQTVSQHQTRIRRYLKRVPFRSAAVAQLEAYLFEECCRTEHTTALRSRAEWFGVP